MKSYWLLIISAFLVAGLVGYIYVRKLYGKSSTYFPEFYREYKLKPTPELEAHPAIQQAIQDMRNANLCGIIYNARISPTINNANMGYGCENEGWFSFHDELDGSVTGRHLPPYPPFGVNKFAILPREKGFIVVTEGGEGSNTFEELVAGIPKVVAAAVKLYPILQEQMRQQKSVEEQKAQLQKKKQEEVKKSFDR